MDIHFYVISESDGKNTYFFDCRILFFVNFRQCCKQQTQNQRHNPYHRIIGAPFQRDDRQVAELIIRLCSGQTALLIKNDDSLGEELQLDVAFYEMKNSYLCPTFIQAL